MNKTIAIFRTGGIGDVILSTVSINIIMDAIPGVKILWFGRNPVNELIKHAFKDVSVYEISGENTYTENFSIIKNSSQQVHAIIDLQHSPRTILLGLLSSLHFKCSYTTWNKLSFQRSLLVFQSKIRGRKFTFDLLKKLLPNRHELMANCTVRALNKINIFIPQKNYSPAFQLLISTKKQKNIAICLGAKFSSKVLALSHIFNIIDLVIRHNYIQRIYLLGDVDQKHNGESILKSYSLKIEIINLCGSTSLSEAADCLSSCLYAVVNDSGLAHLSEAVNTPVLMFYGPTHEKFGYRPHLAKSRILSVNLGCRPCHKNGDTTCRFNDHACSGLISEIQLSNLISGIFNG
jgi:ADP-heptose:LPS heptosyltransferase